MNLQYIETFLTVARFGSINKASAALFLSQSTLTHRLHQLEEELGTALFVRTGSGVTLTIDGKRFLPIASALIEQLRIFAQGTERAKSLSIVAGKAFASYELPRLLGAYRKLHPDFTCYVRSTLFDESVHALLSGAADLAFVGSEIYHPQVQQRNLPDDRIVLITAPTHPWSVAFPGFSAWGNQEVIAFGDSSAPFRQRVDHFFAQNGILPNIIMELDSISAVKRMVIQGLGVAMLPERTVREETAKGELCQRDIAKGNLTRPTLIAYGRHKEADADCMRFLDWVLDAYE